MLQEHFGALNLDADGAPEPDALHLEGVRLRAQRIPVVAFGMRARPLVVPGVQFSLLRYHLKAVKGAVLKQLTPEQTQALLLLRFLLQAW